MSKRVCNTRPRILSFGLLTSATTAPENQGTTTTVAPVHVNYLSIVHGRDFYSELKNSKAENWIRESVGQASSIAGSGLTVLEDGIPRSLQLVEPLPLTIYPRLSSNILSNHTHTQIVIV